METHDGRYSTGTADNQQKNQARFRQRRDPQSPQGRDRNADDENGADHIGGAHPLPQYQAINRTAPGSAGVPIAREGLAVAEGDDELNRGDDDDEDEGAADDEFIASRGGGEDGVQKTQDGELGEAGRQWTDDLQGGVELARVGELAACQGCRVVTCATDPDAHCTISGNGSSQLLD